MFPACRGDEMESKVVCTDCWMSLEIGEGPCVRGGVEV